MTTTIEEFQKNPGAFIEKVQSGVELLLMSNNQPIVKLTAVPEAIKSPGTAPKLSKPRTIKRPAGWAKGKINISGDIEGPVLNQEEWGRLGL